MTVSEGAPDVPVEPRDAATVVLLRSSTEVPLEVFVMVRRTTMDFAGGVVAFPGGGVAPGDGMELELEASLLDRLGASHAGQAAAVLAAAVRELEEETGVVVPVSALGLWDAWTTPTIMPKRYRTWFFTALLPEGQEALELSTESSSVTWVTPAEALARADAGEWELMPPTYSSFLRLATYASAEEAIADCDEAVLEMFIPDWAEGGLRLPAWAAELAAARPGARWR